MMREQIEGLLGHGDFTCTPVRNGNSDAQVCKVQAGGKTWAAKIFPQKPCLDEWYALLREIGEPHLVSAWVCQETEGTVWRTTRKRLRSGENRRRRWSKNCTNNR